MEELTSEEKLLIAWALGVVRGEIDDYDTVVADSILRKLRT